MKKAELLEALKPFTDDIEILRRVEDIFGKPTLKQSVSRVIYEFPKDGCAQIILE